MEVKLILVGDAGVGKTCLAKCYMGNPFEVQSANVDPATLLRKNVTLADGTEVKLAIWDTAGQERYRSLQDMYYRSADAAIVCCDKEHIDSVDEFVNLLKEKEPNVAIFVSLTKSDTYEESAKQELLTQLQEKAKSLDVKCVMATSAKTEDGVSDLFTAAAQDGYVVAQGREAKPPAPAEAQGTGRRCC